MAIRMFPLIAYLASSVYLVCWVIRLLRAIYLRGRNWANPKRLMFSLKTLVRVSVEKGTLVYLVGMLFGGLATFWLIHIFIQEWLLVIFVVLGVLGDEMRISSTDMRLLEVVIFFERLAANTGENQDLFGALTSVIQELPEGDVQKCAREAVLRRCSGDSFERSLKPLGGINPFLEEFLLTLQLSGWRNRPGFYFILNRLMVRAGRKWDCISRILLIKDKSRHYIRFGQGVLFASMWVIIISNLSALTVVMPALTVITLAGLALLVLGGLFYLLLTNHWLRRSLAIFIFTIAMTSYANSLVIPIPSWIHVETISYQSDSSKGIVVVTPQIATIYEGVTVASQMRAALNNPPIAAVTNPTSTPTPTGGPSTILNPPYLTATQVIPEVMNPCRFLSYQPR
ncbi:MAG: hypothetical protein C3F13_16345 [Anaerolineales bacterium]|nr:MAG: hypothetical protein C3F13_16345 [Anaerolineales bacterium]